MTAPSPTPTPAPAPSVHGAADAHDAVRAEKLTKLYGTTRALLDFDASFAPGAYVFPGGGIDAADAATHHLARRRPGQGDLHLTQAIAAIRQAVPWLEFGAAGLELTIFGLIVVALVMWRPAGLWQAAR